MSAHSFLDGKRHWNVRNIQHYITRLETGDSPCADTEVLGTAAARQEQIWLQLRTSAGVQLTGAEIHTLQGAAKFQGLLQDGLLQLVARRLCLTPRGFLLADAIGVEVVACLETSR
jgi:coproporphyrinogen III oxidase-like Fe-S oxidoreductase